MQTIDDVDRRSALTVAVVCFTILFASLMLMAYGAVQISSLFGS